MPTADPGDRVFAILSADDEVVRLIGRGVYDGYQPVTDEPLPDPLPQDAIDEATANQKWWDDNHDRIVQDNAAEMRGRGAEQDEIDAYIRQANDRRAKQPPFEERVRQEAEEIAGPLRLLRITLDDERGYTWGMVCWWAHEARYDEVVAGRRVELVDPPPLPAWVLQAPTAEETTTV